MKLYLYDTATGRTVLELEDVLSYTADRVVTKRGVYAPLAEGCELSAQPESAQALREAWRAAHPSDTVRLDELEALMAQLLYGGERT